MLHHAVKSRKEASKNQSGVGPVIKALSDVSICKDGQVNTTILTIHIILSHNLYSGKTMLNLNPVLTVHEMQHFLNDSLPQFALLCSNCFNNGEGAIKINKA